MGKRLEMQIVPSRTTHFSFLFRVSHTNNNDIQLNFILVHRTETRPRCQTESKARNFMLRVGFQILTLGDLGRESYLEKSSGAVSGLHVQLF